MTRIIRELAEISDRYDVLFCDLWGCVHDGKRAMPAAPALQHGRHIDPGEISDRQHRQQRHARQAPDSRPATAPAPILDVPALPLTAKPHVHPPRFAPA